MRLKQLHPRKKTSYRNYQPESLHEAYKAWQGGMSVYKAAKLYGVPEQTLRDRACGHIKADVTKSGPAALLSEEEEQTLCDHVTKMALFGYGYSYLELRVLATDTAIFSGKLNKNAKLLSEMWLLRFLKRHPSLKGLKPRGLSLVRAKAVSPEIVKNYYEELDMVLKKYDLHGKAHRIFNVDETGITQEHKPPNIVGPKGMTIPAITSPKSSTTTVIACCSATGQSIPPYFVFKGKRLTEDLLNGAVPGTGVCMSDKGWSNSEVFHKYITEHLSKHIPGGLGNEYTLIMYDGATSHFSPSLIQWALQSKVVLMVLPAHSSHLLQPLDVGIFKPFKSAYNRACQEFLRQNVGRQITRYDICELACKAYVKALTPSNIINSFRKTGIVPFNKQAIASECFMPNKITTEKQSQPEQSESQPNECLQTSVASFLVNKIPRFVPPLKRKLTSKIQTSGKEITDSQLAETLIELSNKKADKVSKKIKKFATPFKAVSPCEPGTSGFQKPLESVPSVQRQPKSGPSGFQKHPEPGPSGVQKPRQTDTSSSVSSDESDHEDNHPDSEKCCVCKRFYVNKTNNDMILSIITWGQCDFEGCGHWVHLKFCTKVRVLRRHDSFICPCHSANSEE